MTIRDLKKLLFDLDSDESLFDPPQLGRRIEALDSLDAAAFDAGVDEAGEGITFARITRLRDRLETVNAAIYKSVRRSIRQTGRPGSLLQWLDCCGEPGDPVPGLGYDVLDELIAGVLPLSEPGEVEPKSAEQVFYQPTPIRHLLDLIARAGVSADDVLVDFGSGLGQVCMLASILTGTRAIGIETEATYVESARQCAHNLGLKDRVSFVNADARQADLSAGTVFHLYTPFTGSILRAVLDRLREQASNRPIRVTTLGPCTAVVAQESWLRTDQRADPERIALFQS